MLLHSRGSREAYSSTHHESGTERRRRGSRIKSGIKRPRGGRPAASALSAGTCEGGANEGREGGGGGTEGVCASQFSREQTSAGACGTTGAGARATQPSSCFSALRGMEERKEKKREEKRERNAFIMEAFILVQSQHTHSSGNHALTPIAIYRHFATCSNELTNQTNHSIRC